MSMKMQIVKMQHIWMLGYPCNIKIRVKDDVM